MNEANLQWSQKMVLHIDRPELERFSQLIAVFLGHRATGTAGFKVGKERTTYLKRKFKEFFEETEDAHCTWIARRQFVSDAVRFQAFEVRDVQLRVFIPKKYERKLKKSLHYSYCLFVFIVDYANIILVLVCREYQQLSEESLKGFSVAFWSLTYKKLSEKTLPRVGALREMQVGQIRYWQKMICHLLFEIIKPQLFKQIRHSGNYNIAPWETVAPVLSFCGFEPSVCILFFSFLYISQFDFWISFTMLKLQQAAAAFRSGTLQTPLQAVLKDITVFVAFSNRFWM